MCVALIGGFVGATCAADRQTCNGVYDVADDQCRLLKPTLKLCLHMQAHKYELINEVRRDAVCANVCCSKCYMP